MILLTYQLAMTQGGCSGPVETVTMSARPEEVFFHTGGLEMDRVLSTFLRWSRWSRPPRTSTLTS